MVNMEVITWLLLGGEEPKVSLLLTIETKCILPGAGDHVAVLIVGIQALQGFVPFISPDS